MINCFVIKTTPNPKDILSKKKDYKGVMNKTKAFVLSWLLQRNLLCTNQIVWIINYKYKLIASFLLTYILEATFCN